MNKFELIFPIQSIGIIQKQHQSETHTCMLFSMAYMFYFFKYGFVEAIKLLNKATRTNSILNSQSMDLFRSNLLALVQPIHQNLLQTKM